MAWRATDLPDIVWSSVLRMLTEQPPVPAACSTFQRVTSLPDFAWLEWEYDVLVEAGWSSRHRWRVRKGPGVRLSANRRAVARWRRMAKEEEERARQDSSGWREWWQRQAKRNPRMAFGKRSDAGFASRARELPCELGLGGPPDELRPAFAALDVRSGGGGRPDFFSGFCLHEAPDGSWELEASSQADGKVTTYYTRLGRFPNCHVLWFRSCYCEVWDALALCESGAVEAFHAESDEDAGVERRHRAQGQWRISDASNSQLCTCGLPGSRCCQPMRLALEVRYVRHAAAQVTSSGPLLEEWQDATGWPLGTITLEKESGAIGKRCDVKVVGQAPCANGRVSSRWVYCTSASSGN